MLAGLLFGMGLAVCAGCIALLGRRLSGLVDSPVLVAGELPRPALRTFGQPALGQ